LPSSTRLMKFGAAGAVEVFAGSFLFEVVFVFLLPGLLYANAVALLLGTLVGEGLLAAVLFLAYSNTANLTQAIADTGFKAYTFAVRFDYFAYVFPDALRGQLMYNRAVHLALATAALGAVRCLAGRRRLTPWLLPALRKGWTRLRSVSPVTGLIPATSATWASLKITAGNHWIVGLVFATFIFLDVLARGGSSVSPVFVPPGGFLAAVPVGLWSPLLGAVIVGPSLLPDLLGGNWEIVGHFPLSRVPLLGGRTAFPLLYALLLVASLAGVLALACGPTPVLQTLFLAIPPLLFLGAVGLLASVMVRNQAATFFIPAVYWAFELGFRGRLTGLFYLFPTLQQPAGLLGAVAATPVFWVANRVAIGRRESGLGRGGGTSAGRAVPEPERTVAYCCGCICPAVPDRSAISILVRSPGVVLMNHRLCPAHCIGLA